MKQTILHVMFILADLLGINWWFRNRTGDKTRVLMYHGLATGSLPTFYWTHVDPDRFREQMAYLQKQYRVISPESLTKETSDDTTYSKPPVVLTFDDGLETVYTVARPVLREYDFTAVCFVLPALSDAGHVMWTDLIYRLFVNTTAESIDLTVFDMKRIDFDGKSPESRAQAAFAVAAEAKGRPHESRRRLIEYLVQHCPTPDEDFNDGFRSLTVDQIRELAAGGEMLIAPHSNTHPILATMTTAEQEAEIKTSLDKLREWKVYYLELFAYPNGRRQDFNDDTVRILNDNGIKAAVTTEEGFFERGTDRYRINRIPIGADMRLPEFKARLSGFFSFLKGFKG